MEAVSPFIVAGMEDSLGPRVQSCAVTLAVTAYQTFGMEALRPLLSGLRPAKQTLLMQKFQESEEEVPEDRGGEEPTRSADGFHEPSQEDAAQLVVCGTAMQRHVSSNADFQHHGAKEDEESLMDTILEDS